MRKYRYFSNINWGTRYDPADKAHHVEAEDFDEFLKMRHHL